MIIKPVLDMLHIMGVKEINFLSGCTVLTITAEHLGNNRILGMLQSSVMLVIILAVFVYMMFEKRIHTRNVTNICACGAIGLLLGLQSAFLGIGGGPVNLVVLSYFFSMERKKASLNSLYIILFSQIFSLAVTFLEGSIPQIPAVYLIVMAGAGFLGGLAGSSARQKMTTRYINILFTVLLLVLIAINAGNILQYSGV